MPDFSRRSADSELMDDPDIGFAEFHDCLIQLERINVLTFAYPPTLRFVRRFLKRGESGLHILDAGSGGGDMLRRIAKAARRTRAEVQLTGVDLNPFSARSAALADTASSITLVTGDIFTYAPERQIDLILCSLFTHHLTDAQLVQYLRWVDAKARRGWFINDLHRYWLPFHFIKAATALFSRNRLIRSDAAISVSRSFTKADWRRLLGEAGIGDRARVRWHFPFRICVSCIKE